MRTFIRVAAVFSLLGLLACSESPTAPARELPIPFTTVFDSITGELNEVRAVARNESEMRAVWRDLVSDLNTEPPPTVDFTRYDALISSKGGASCDTTKIVGVHATEHGVRVDVLDVSRDPIICPCQFSAATNPVHVVIVRKSSAVYRFAVARRVSCPPSD
jgi:hypothetical protein